MNKQRQELAREAETIMLTGGFTQARAEHMGRFWRVCGELADKNEHSGTTFHQLDPQDPRELARSLVALAKQPVTASEPEPDGYESAEAIANEVPTFAPEDDPFGVAPSPEEVENPGHEGDGETGAEADPSDDGEQLLGAAAEMDTDPAAEPAGDLLWSEPADDGGEPDAIDADFTEDPLLEFGGEEERPAEKPEEGGPQFVFGPPANDVETLRSQRIGDVVRLSIIKQAAIWEESGTTQAAYQDLLNTVMRDTVQGVYIGPPEQFTAFTSQQGWANKVAAVRSKELDHVGFLTGATPPELEAFNPEAGWPE